MVKIYALVAAAAAIAIAAIFHPPSAPAIATRVSPPPSLAGRPRSAPPVVVVYVAGAVLHPGLYRLVAGARADDAVKAAGGLLRSADPAAVNLAEVLQDGEEIMAPVPGQTVRRTRRAGGGSVARKRKLRKSAAAPAPATQVDLNTADAGSLQTLPGIGAEMARRLVAFREANGRFGSLDELADVAGMTPRRIEQVTPYLYAGR